MNTPFGGNGVLQVVPPAQLEQQLQARQDAAAPQPSIPDPGPLAGYIRTQFDIFRNHRNTASGWSQRLIDALRAYSGQYAPSKLAEIRRFQGSEIYMRLSAQKCRAASSLLRDIYLGQDRPWALKEAESPTIPPEIAKSIDMLLQQEGQMVAQYTGQPPNAADVQKRRSSLLDEAMHAARKKAQQQARASEDKIEDMLQQGGFYSALAAFLVDLPIFPFACIKGPVVRVIPEVQWPPGGGQPTIAHNPRLTWERVAPFDLWWTPGVSDIANANVIEKLRITRAELNDLLDLPGYDKAEIEAVLDEYGRGGLYDAWDTTDAERAVLESRENPQWNRSGLITMFEFNGNVQGRTLQEHGIAVPEPLRDYHMQVWMIGSHVIKSQLTPSPRMRHPYFMTSFEKVPGTPLGNSLIDMLSDLQEAGNSVLRMLINNVGIASGPQVVVHDNRLTAAETGEDMYPWKRWHVNNDAAGSDASKLPIEFFQPKDNSQALIMVLDKIISYADDVSAIPKYVGGQSGGGAGRTASGLAMLMGNAAKILQTVSANVDRDVVEQALLQLQDLILLTDTSGLLTGEEKVSVQGVNVAIQRETLRQRQIEFLSATANPLDQKITGIKGRAAVLRNVSSTIGMDSEDIVPPEDQLDRMEKDEKEHAQQGNLDQRVQEGIEKGVQAGVARISTELTAGLLASHAHMPEGMGTHIGTLPEGQGAEEGGGAPGGAPGGQEEARQASGQKPGQTSNAMGPITDTVGNQKGAGAKPVSGGVG